MSTTIAAQLPTEKQVLQDEQTGAAIWQLTNAPCVNHAPYFLNPAWAGANHDMLIITSYRAGAPNLYGIQLPDGVLQQLTTSGDVSPWSACVSPDGKHVYYAAATQLRAVNTTNLQETVLTNLPPSSWLGNCSISPRRLGNLAGGAERRPEHHSGRAHRRRRRTRALCHRSTRGPRAVESRRGARCSFLPTCRACGWWKPTARIRVRCARRPARSGSPTKPGSRITRSSLPTGPTRSKPSGATAAANATSRSSIAGIPRPAAIARRSSAIPRCPTWDCNSSIPASGERETLCHPRASSQGFQWSEPLPYFGETAPDDAYGPQWSHPHPSYTPDGRAVVYTSDISGHAQVYLAFVE